MNPFLPFLLALFLSEPAEYSATLYQANGQSLTWGLTLDEAPLIDDANNIVAVETRKKSDDDKAIIAEVIYKITFHFSSGFKLVRYRDTKGGMAGFFTVYKSFKKLANGKFKLEGESLLSVNNSAIDYIEIEEINSKTI